MAFELYRLTAYNPNHQTVDFFQFFGAILASTFRLLNCFYLQFCLLEVIAVSLAFFFNQYFIGISVPKPAVNYLMAFLSLWKHNSVGVDLFP